MEEKLIIDNDEKVASDDESREIDNREKELTPTELFVAFAKEKYGDDPSDEQAEECILEYLKSGGAIDVKLIRNFLYKAEDTGAVQGALHERLASGDDVKKVLSEVGEKYDEEGLPSIITLAEMVEMVEDEENGKQCREFFSDFIVGKAVEDIKDGDGSFYELAMLADRHASLLEDSPQSEITDAAKKIVECCNDGEATLLENQYEIEIIGELLKSGRFLVSELFGKNGPTEITQDYLLSRKSLTASSVFYDERHRRVIEIEEQAGIVTTNENGDSNVAERETHANICAALARGFKDGTIKLIAESFAGESVDLAPFIAFSSEEEFVKMIPTLKHDRSGDELHKEYQPAIDKYKEVKEGQGDAFLAIEDLLKYAAELDNDQTKLEAWKARRLEEMYRGRMKSEERKITLEQNRRRQEWLERDINSRLTTIDEIELQSHIQDSGIMREEDQEYNGQAVPIYRISSDYPFRAIVTQTNMDGTWTSNDETIAQLKEAMRTDPSIWMRREEEAEGGSNVIHASYTENDKGRAPDVSALFYGFGHIKPKSLIETYSSDGNTPPWYSNPEEMREYNIEDFGKMDTSVYNELVLRRYQETGEPLYPPDYIVCYSGSPTDEMLLHAAHHHVPIIIIEPSRPEKND